MKNSKQELLNDVLTGLVVAATFASVVPGGAMAQGLQSVVSGASTNVMAPFLTIVTYVCYGVGTVLSVAGVAHMKKHADNPSSNPLGPALGKLGAGAALLAAPYVIGVTQGTGSGALGPNTGTFTAIGGF